MQSFRQLGLRFFQLDPANFISLPSFAFQCALKKTGVKIELLTDSTLYLFFECDTLRGGFSFIGERYGLTNIPYLLSHWDPTLPKRFLGYKDANNLVGFSLTLSLTFSLSLSLSYFLISRVFHFLLLTFFLSFV